MKLKNLYLAKTFDIPIKTSIFWWLFFGPMLVLPLFFSPLESLVVLGELFLVFICITAHELGHSLVAQHFGFRTTKIVWYPFGAAAYIDGDWGENPNQEFLIAITGPLVSLVLGLALLHFDDSEFGLGKLNLIWAGFNLFIPVFPLDGGRVIRSTLARWLPLAKATKISFIGSCVTSVLFSIFAFSVGWYMIAVIVPFIALAAGGGEYLHIKSQKTLKELEAELEKERALAQRGKYLVEKWRRQDLEDEMNKLLFRLAELHINLERACDENTCH